MLDKPQSKDLAMALAKARDARKRRKLWIGGALEPSQDGDMVTDDYEHQDTAGEPGTLRQYEEDKPMTYATGGEVDDEEEDDNPYAMRKRKMREGGPSSNPEVASGIKSAFHAGGLAAERETAYLEPKSGYHAGGLAKKREPKEMEEKPRMAAGGLARKPEPRYDEDDSIPSSSRVANLREDVEEEEIPAMFSGGEYKTSRGEEDEVTSPDPYAERDGLANESDDEYESPAPDLPPQRDDIDDDFVATVYRKRRAKGFMRGGYC